MGRVGTRLWRGRCCACPSCSSRTGPRRRPGGGRRIPMPSGFRRGWCCRPGRTPRLGRVGIAVVRCTFNGGCRRFCSPSRRLCRRDRCNGFPTRAARKQQRADPTGQEDSHDTSARRRSNTHTGSWIIAMVGADGIGIEQGLIPNSDRSRNLDPVRSGIRHRGFSPSLNRMTKHDRRDESWPTPI